MKQKSIVKFCLLHLLFIYLTAGAVGGENLILCIENNGLAQIELSNCHSKEKLHSEHELDCTYHDPHDHKDCFDLDLNLGEQALVLIANLSFVHLPQKTLPTELFAASTSKLLIRTPLSPNHYPIPPPYLSILKSTVLTI